MLDMVAYARDRCHLVVEGKVRRRARGVHARVSFAAHWHRCHSPCGARFQLHQLRARWHVPPVTLSECRRDGDIPAVFHISAADLRPQLPVSLLKRLGC